MCDQICETVISENVHSKKRLLKKYTDFSSTKLKKPMKVMKFKINSIKLNNVHMQNPICISFVYNIN